MATATTQQIDYTYEDYLEAYDDDPDNPKLTQAEFEATLNSYLNYTQQIGDAYATYLKLARKSPHESQQAWGKAENLREQRRHLQQALLIGG